MQMVLTPLWLTGRFQAACLAIHFLNDKIDFPLLHLDSHVIIPLIQAPMCILSIPSEFLQYIH